MSGLRLAALVLLVVWVGGLMLIWALLRIAGRSDRWLEEMRDREEEP